MNGLTRRNGLLEQLKKREEPITGSTLSKIYEVSRQIIVQDIALLRAQGHKIISTADGYMSYKIKEGTCKRVYCVTHPEEAIEEELLIIVDNGGNLLNTIVSHSIYGEISIDLHLGSRRQVSDFIAKVKSTEFVPLMTLTGGAHYHTVEADTEAILNDIEEELDRKGYIVKA